MTSTKNRSCVRSLVATIVVATAFARIAPTQTNPQWAAPRAGDAEVYASYFHFHDDFMNWVDERKTMSAARGQKLSQRAAELYKIDPGDLAAVTAISREVLRDLDKLEKDRRAYVDLSNARKTSPDSTALRDFQLTRKAILLSGALKLKRSLSPASWAGLENYINSRHRPGIRSMSVSER